MCIQVDTRIRMDYKMEMHKEAEDKGMGKVMSTSIYTVT